MDVSVGLPEVNGEPRDDAIHELMHRDASQDDWFAYFGLIDESLRNAYADPARTETHE